MKCDVNSYLWGAAGDPASRNPETVIMGSIRGGNATQVAVELPNGETLLLPLSGVFGWTELSFEEHLPGLPQAGGTYTCTFLDADGNPIPGAVESDVYLGGYEPDPPTNVRAEVVEGSILVTWEPSPVIPGAFDLAGSPPVGQYHVSVAEPAVRELYIWVTGGPPQQVTSHLIPFRRQDLDPEAVGFPMEEWGDGVYGLAVHTGSWAPEGTAGRHHECTARDTAEDWYIVIEGGQVRVEKP
jgi:hypothetical protein